MTLTPVIEMAEELLHEVPARQWLNDPLMAAGISTDREKKTCRPEILPDDHTLMCAFFFMGRWAVSGYPTIRIGHGAACGLMATNGNSEDLAEMVRSPWPAFVVRLPDNLLWVSKANEDRAVQLLFVSEFSGEWVYGFETGDGSAAWSGMNRAAKMWDYSTEWSFSGDEEVEDSALRTAMLVRRLIAGICLQLSNQEDKESARIGKPASVRNRNRMPGELPVTDNYEVRLSVKIDERVVAATREYARHGGRSPTVQSLVRGHWKKQAHGPERSLRKMIYIAPFWRGPIDAPISMRVGGKPLKEPET